MAELEEEDRRNGSYSRHLLTAPGAIELCVPRAPGASGHAKRWAALTLIEPHAATSRPAADKRYDSADLVMALRYRAVSPHVAQNTSGRHSAIDDHTTRLPAMQSLKRIRKRIEEAFGWAKTVFGLRNMRHRGLPKVDWQFTLAMAA